MDYLALMACYGAGIVALIFASKHSQAGFITHLYSLLAGIFLASRFVSVGQNTHAYSPAQWTGEAETGPVTLLILLLAVALPFVVGWEREYERRAK
jgi:uncharacterized membrane protein required for colicin V production